MPNAIKPRDISLESQSPRTFVHPFAGFLGNFEQERLAELIVADCSRENEWLLFTIVDLVVGNRISERPMETDVLQKGLNGLLESGRVVHVRRNYFRLSIGCIRECKRCSDLVLKQKK